MLDPHPCYLLFWQTVWWNWLFFCVCSGTLPVCLSPGAGKNGSTVAVSRGKSFSVVELFGWTLALDRDGYKGYHPLASDFGPLNVWDPGLYRFQQLAPHCNCYGTNCGAFRTSVRWKGIWDPYGNGYIRPWRGIFVLYQNLGLGFCNQFLMLLRLVLERYIHDKGCTSSTTLLPLYPCS